MSAPRLLVIDHDPAVQRAVETTLGSEGCEVTAVGDGLTALDVALATTPDVILADYRMEGTNIFRFLEKLKQKELLKNVALLLLVNPGDVYDELTLRLVGVTDFLRKPLNSKEMVDRVKRYNPIPAAVPAAPTPATSTSQQTPPKIEDLLGWSQDAASPFSELSQDRNVGFDFSLPAADNSSGALDATQFLDRNELTPTDHPTPLSEDDGALTEIAHETHASEAGAPSSPVSTPGPQPSKREMPSPATPIKSVSTAENSGLAIPTPQALETSAKEIARSAVEKVAWDVVPGLAKDSLDRVINEVVERIVWDVVPAIAELAIKREIERLTRDQN